MNLLTLEQILQMHVLVISETGGSAGLRDLGRLEAAIATQAQNVFDEEVYSDAFQKAAALIRCIVGDHPFVDGNKRTAMLAGITFLKINGVSFQAEPGILEDFAVLIAVDKLSILEITEWLKECQSLKN